MVCPAVLPFVSLGELFRPPNVEAL
jgi:hypothetical protein